MDGEVGPARTRNLHFAVAVVTVLVAVAHGGQSIVFSGWAEVPGGLADARLVNLLLEHVFQSLRGATQFLSPSQFFPAGGTLVFSDNHLGTVPIYALFRLLGASIEGAFQGWFLTIVGLNTAAVLFLFHRLGIDPRIAGPAAFFAACSSAVVFKAGHPQTLPFYPFVFALTYFLRFLRTGDSRALCGVAAFMVLQCLTYLYYAYFAALIFGAIACLAVVVLRRPKFFGAVYRSSLENKGWLLACAVISIVVVAVNMYPYVQYSHNVGTRPLLELATLAPAPGAWFSAPPTSLVHSKQQFLDTAVYPVENTLFSSWIAVALTVAAVGSAFLKRRSWTLRLAAVLAAAAVALIILITSWHGSEANIYLWLAARVESLRAFRAIGRIGYLLFVMQAASAAILLNWYLKHARSAAARWICLGLPVAMAVEGVAVGQQSYSKHAARERGQAVIAAWKDAGARDVLAFAPGYSNQSYETTNLDAWYAALVLGKATVNGYSGGCPPTHCDFTMSLSEPAFERLASRLQLPPASVSLVRDWSEPHKSNAGIATYRLKHDAVALSDVSEMTLARLEEETVAVTVANRADEELAADVFNVFLSYRIYDDRGEPVAEPASLRTRIGSMRPGESRTFRMRLQAPGEPGVYQVRLSLVHEGVAWWADLGCTGSTINLTVR